MKKLKLFTCMLLCAGMVLGLTACGAKETENNDVVNSTVDSDTMDSAIVDSVTVDNANVDNTTVDSSTVVQESIPEANDDVESSESADADNDTATSRPDNIFPSMGVDNGFFFATPIINGEPVHAKMDEVRFITGGGDGIIVNLAGIGEEYIVSSLNAYGVSFADSNLDGDDYNQDYCLEPTLLLYFEEDPVGLEVLEKDGDITYNYVADTLYAFKGELSVAVYGVGKEISEETRAAVKNIFDNATLVTGVDPEFATSMNFDAVAFDCGWYIENINFATWQPKEMTLFYGLKDGHILLEFELKEEPEEETHDGYAASYSIPMEDGTYLITYINAYGSDVLDVHNWSEVEAFLNGRN